MPQFFCYIFLKLIVTSWLSVIYVIEDNGSNIWVVIIWLIWTGMSEDP